MTEPLDDRMLEVLGDAAKRRGLPPPDPTGKRKSGRPRSADYVAPDPDKKPAPPTLGADEEATLQSLLLERLKRKIDGLKLYRPMPIQQAFHECNAREKLIRGANRSGKTTAAAVEVARALTADDGEDSIWYIVGKDGKELAQVMYKLLFRAGAFKIIRDLDTGYWRAFSPITDETRRKQAKLAPPLIPPRLVKSISWENKAAGQPQLIKLHNGKEVHCFSSNALPPHGTQIDGAWFDEEILNQSWYSEVAARLIDRNGRFLWSATPQAGTVQLYDLHDRADKQKRQLPVGERSLVEFVITLADNIHLTDAQKKEFESKLSEEEIQVRVHGEFAAHGMRVFPEFTEDAMLCDYFEIPIDWTTYIAVDPGRQTCAALFVAFPPEGDHVYAFDELYLHQCSAELFAQRMAQKCVGRTPEAFIIDHQEGRKAETGSGRTVEEQYSEALAKYRVACRRTGSEFTWGAADPQGGIEAVRQWLRHGPTGPKLRVLKDRCDNFIWEMKKYWYERDRDGRVTDKPRARGPVHLCACIRYIVQDNPKYVAPQERKPRESEVFKFAKSLLKERGSGGAINLGPGSFTIGVGAT